jgi:E3 ubiquitin-protein ligase RNF115/126
MAAAGPQGPLPASDVVIAGLPRFTFTDESLGTFSMFTRDTFVEMASAKSVYKDCPVCKDDFAAGDEVMRVPCA